MRTPAILLGLVLSLASLAQATPDEQIRAFFATYSAGKVDKAIDELYRSNQWISRKSDDLDNLKRQLQGSIDLMGDYRGYAQLGTKDVIGDLVLHDVLVKYDRQPLRFRFMFYRADKTWMLYSFAFDDSIDEELKEAIKPTYLHP
jgi:hypothetical protein